MNDKPAKLTKRGLKIPGISGTFGRRRNPEPAAPEPPLECPCSDFRKYRNCKHIRECKCDFEMGLVGDCPKHTGPQPAPTDPVARNAEGRKRCPHGLPPSECKPCQVQPFSRHSDERPESPHETRPYQGAPTPRAEEEMPSAPTEPGSGVTEPPSGETK